jgi:hypothetical protein
MQRTRSQHVSHARLVAGGGSCAPLMPIVRHLLLGHYGMAGCVLRASGADFQPEIFLRASSFCPCNVFRKGERKAESRTWDTSGITIVVSEASDDFAQQVIDAIEFLKSHRVDILSLQKSKGLEEIGLDFGVNRRNDFLQSYLFPAELIRLAGEFSMDLEVSIYGTD